MCIRDRVDLVGDSPDERSAGRLRWRFYADRGYPIDRHDAARPAAREGRESREGRDSREPRETATGDDA